MSRYSLNPDRLFDRPWRAGHPFRPKTGRLRRLGMLVLLVVLCLVIWGYGYVTDPKRVRAMAEDYLSELVGGRVTVAGASLTIFEGLRLDGVRVYVDDAGEVDAPDALVFSARTFVVRYDPRSMARGELRATQIVAEKPQVHLARDRDTGRWNFERLGRDRKPKRPEPSGPPPAPSVVLLPELMLRNARVEISELRRDGPGGAMRNDLLGHVAIDGQLTPESSGVESPGLVLGSHDRVRFTLQSRGASDELGPLATGSVHLASGRVIARLEQFEFDRDVRSMLPEFVRAWWERHALAGRVDVPSLDYTPARGDAPERFRIRAELKGVSLSVPPQQWMSGDEVDRRHAATAAAGTMRDVYAAAGFFRPGGSPVPTGPHDDPPPPAPPVPLLKPADPAPDRAATRAPPVRTPAAALASLLDVTPIELRQVSGAFEFTEAGVEVRGLSGRVENNLLVIDGRIKGYDPDAPMSLTVRSGDEEHLQIPAAPRYVWSLPRAVRELYEKIRPQGTCKVGITVARSEANGPIVAGGFVELVDAQFMIEDFKYPVRRTSGRIEIARDADKGQDWLLIKGVRGRGFVDGPNRDRTLAVDGWVGPVGPPGCPEAGGLIRIRAKDVVSEPTLIHAFDRDVRDALAIFDAPGKGEFPRFRGDVICEAYKDVGTREPFRVRVDLDLKSADGALKGFQYPLRGMSGQVRIRDGYADVVDVRMPRGDATMKVHGRVAWHVPNRELPPELRDRRTDLRVAVRNLPIDDDLFAALPPDAVEWIKQVGVAGRVDVDGRLLGGVGGVPPADPDAPPLDYDLAVRLHDGTVRPGGKQFEVTGVAGHLRVTPGRLDLLDLTGTRGKATLSAVGQAVFTGPSPRTVFVGTAKNLALDAALYDALPEAARSAWDEVRPGGTLDAEVTCANLLTPAGKVPATAAESAVPGSAVAVVDLNAKPNTQPTQPSALVLDLPAVNGREAVRRDVPLGLHALLRPREMSAALTTVNYPLDHLGGEIAVGPDRVELRKLTGRRGKAEVSVSGTGTLRPLPQWDLTISGRNLPTDDALRTALPPTLAALLDSLAVKGTLGFDLDRFSYRSAAPAAAASATAPAAEPEIDLAGRVLLADTAMDVGVPLQRVDGAVALAAAIRGGRLQSLRGNIEAESFDLAGREVTRFRADLVKPADRPELTLANMRALVGGGDLAGHVVLAFPDDAANRYGLVLTLRNADVRELGKESAEGLKGLATASLALEGSWGKHPFRRGRGDVVVTGKELYRIPLVLGLFQVTNLGLPVSTPFSTGTARYSLDGDRVTFQQIELRNNAMVMTGDGFMDFGSKQVRMTFVTDNAAGFKVPFLQDLWRGAQQELLRIHVRGTVQDPKVEARPLGTFVTSVDEVFKGDAPKEKRKK